MIQNKSSLCVLSGDTTTTIGEEEGAKTIYSRVGLKIAQSTHMIYSQGTSLLIRPLIYSKGFTHRPSIYSKDFTLKDLDLLTRPLLYSQQRCSAVALHPGLDHRSIFSTGPFHPLKSNHIITLVQSTLQTTAVNFHWRSNQECWATWFSSKSVDRNKIHPVIWVQPLLAIENLTWKRRLCYCYSYIFIDFLTPGH